MAPTDDERSVRAEDDGGARAGTLLRMSLIQLNGIVKSYGGRRILDGLDFDVVEGARIGVIGPNGGGKSTLLRVLAAEEHADAGDVTRRRGLTVAYLSQQPEGDERDELALAAGERLGRERQVVVFQA